MGQSLAGERRLAAAPWRPRLVFGLLLSYFAMFGVIIGAKGVLWAEVVRTLGLTTGTFGTALLASPLISVAVLLAGGQISAWLGKKRLALLSLLCVSSGVLLLAWSDGLLGLIVALLVTGLSHGLLEMAMNGATLDWERATGRHAMNFMHAGFSGGAVLGALGAGLLLGQGWSYGAVLLLLAALGGIVLLATLPVRYPPSAARGTEPSNPLATLRTMVRSRALLLLALLGVLSIVGESATSQWGVLYLRGLGAPAVVGGAAYALFNSAMFVGRLVNVPLVARLGERTSLSVSGIGLMAGTILLLIPAAAETRIALATAGFMLLGLGVAGVIPTALSLGARLAPGASDAVAGGLMAAAYGGLMLCPPLIGWLAQLFSLRVAWLGVGLSGLAILWLARRIGSR